MRVKSWLRHVWLAFGLPSRSPAMISSREAYRQWAVSYPPTPHNPLMQAEQAAMLRLMPPLKGMVVLDLGGGTGRYGLIAWKRGARVVLSVDNSAAMLERNPLPRRILGSIEHIPLPRGRVDVLVCALALGHLPALAGALAEISRVLKPGGSALVSDFHPFMFLNGARRTFETERGVYAVEHYAHLYADCHAAAAHAGLTIDAVAEPALDDGGMPAVIIYRLSKPRSAVR